MIHIKIIDEAKRLVSKDRESDYGNKRKSHENVAKLWSAYLNIEITPHDAAILMCLLKIARTQLGKNRIDNYVDLVGYAAIAGELSKEEDKQLDLNYFKVGGTDPD
jgi:hypothetical protein